MSLVTLEKRSHVDPEPYRIKLEDADRVLGPNASIPRNTSIPVKHSSSNVTIVGAGFGGIGSAMLIKEELKENDFVLFEKHDNFGGTWYANTYPGCASDIPALWYSFSKEMNTNWSRIQPPQYEMEEYILKVVEKHDLRRYAKFQHAVNEVRYNEDGTWTLEVTDLKTGGIILHTTKIVYLCGGGLVHPNQLKAKGLENFKGEYMHSALYDHSVSLKGKNVVIVGNGCSANQLVPAVLDRFDPKSVVQISRSKQYIMPPITKILYYFYRICSVTTFTLLLCRWLVVIIAEARFPLFKGNSLISRIVRKFNAVLCLRYMRRNCPKKFQDKVIPEFKVGCKRLIFDYSYLKSLHDPRIDLRSENIDHVKERSIVLTDGSEIPADVIIACTGYDLTKSFSALNVVGRNKTTVLDFWTKQGVSAYETILVRDCPNMFFIGGPNSATGHSSVVMAIENGLTFARKISKHILDGRYKSVVVKTKKYNEWFERIQKEHKKSVFGTPFGGCQSWYTLNNVNFTTYPYSQLTYWWNMNHPRWQDFEIE
ncbi:FAD/NAD(P)-binding domain-containing protein [Suhomyces tanzawaensis NRRL Y-17324]|uniref:FAD/NAD(P)-binding domain-containing protein n=1 Tax=Suhomyces tanzawaensis NRRL Y-17324 TaxID=984487 RepID=A0A1E4SG89_9ASCO|nr:FAD/NAD(P)-binding domain-containing protein [Suhomyces tanzawaensis NRRL Y-17324]ODV78528.1 FAD/NAD(P)-binding domain-containing protein [Suhomyces tanzawaensis NRRL Y-17324]